VRIGDDLRSRSHAFVLAAGDCAALDEPVAKAGVIAVRQGPVLAANLLALATGAPLRGFAPPRRWLLLIGTGDARALAVRGRLAAEGAWAWRWKQRIDRAFVARHRAP